MVYKPEEERLPPRKTGKRGKRKFTIETRYLGQFSRLMDWGNWHKSHSYETEKQRDEAFKALKKNSRDWKFLEYRKGEDR